MDNKEVELLDEDLSIQLYLGKMDLNMAELIECIIDVKNPVKVSSVINILKFYETESNEIIKQLQMSEQDDEKDEITLFNIEIMKVYSMALENVEKYEGKFYKTVYENLTVCFRLLPYLSAMIKDMEDF